MKKVITAILIICIFISTYALVKLFIYMNTMIESFAAEEETDIVIEEPILETPEIIEEPIIIEAPTVKTDLERITEMNTIVIKNKDLACDTDGASSSYGSKNWQPETSYQYIGSKKYWGKSLDASKVNYIVYNNKEYYGCLGIVIDLSDNSYVYVICGDYNKNSNWNELSLHALRDLGYNGKSKPKATGNNAPENGNFVTIIFKDSKVQFSKPTNINDNIKIKVITLLGDININNVILDLHN